MYSSNPRSSDLKAANLVKPKAPFPRKTKKHSISIMLSGIVSSSSLITAATGMAAMAGIMKSIAAKTTKTIGNFWQFLVDRYRPDLKAANLVKPKAPFPRKTKKHSISIMLSGNTIVRHHAFPVYYCCNGYGCYGRYHEKYCCKNNKNNW